MLKKSSSILDETLPKRRHRVNRESRQPALALVVAAGSAKVDAQVGIVLARFALQTHDDMTRREFLKQAGVVVAGATAGAAALHSASGSPGVQSRAAASAAVAILIDPADPVANAGPARWALEQLRQALVQRQIAVQTAARMADIPPANHCLLATGGPHPLAREILTRASVDLPRVPESLAIAAGRTAGRGCPIQIGLGPNLDQQPYYVVRHTGNPAE